MRIELPPTLSRRFAELPQTPEEATWSCLVCGTMEPRRLFLQGMVRYVRARCACQKAEQERKDRERHRREWYEWQALRTYSWLGTRWSDASLRGKTFENFDPRKQPVAFEATRLFAEYPSGTLVLYGSFGTGKTHLLAAVCNAVLLYTPPITSLFTTAPKLFNAIQERIQEREGYWRLIESAIATPLLVIDDIDKAKYSQFREEIYFAILDERVKARRPTAISTNRLSTLTEYVGGSVCSRLKVGQVAAEMIGDDYREEM